MSLVDVARYRQLTGDQTTPDQTVADLLAAAQDLAVAYCRRPLESAERTETMPADDRGRGYPAATPVTAVEAGWTIAPGGAYLCAAAGPGGGWPVDPREGVTVTYTGGYTAATVPATLALAIIRTARDLLARTATDDGTGGPGDGGMIPPGAASVRVGDASVTFATPGGYTGGSGAGTGAGAAAGFPADAAGLLRGYRRRVI